MTTRGVFGFRINEKDLLAYNGADSEPHGLGVRVLGELRGVDDWDAARERVGDLVLYDAAASVEPRPKRGRFDATLAPYLDGRLRVFATANGFIRDSLRCGWAYIANLDTETFEVWRGLQRVPCREDWQRYGTEAAPSGYYPCALASVYELEDLPTDSGFLAHMRPYMVVRGAPRRPWAHNLSTLGESGSRGGA